MLRFLQGLSIAEAADVMGRSQGAIKQLQLRASGRSPSSYRRRLR